MNQPYEYMKPRLFYRSNDHVWVCARMIDSHPLMPVRAYFELGIGKTPEEAWKDAHPEYVFSKLKNWIKSCLNLTNT